MKKVVLSGAQGKFYCPGCQTFHRFTKTDDNFQGSEEIPTVTARLVYADAGTVKCTLIITQGVVAYSMDSRHKLAGLAVPLPDISTGVPR